MNWDQIRLAVEAAAPEWVLVGHDLPRSTANSLQRGNVKAMVGLAVETRNGYVSDGVRRCSIYARKESE